MNLPVTPRPGQYIVEKDTYSSEITVSDGGIFLPKTEDRAVSSGVVVAQNDPAWPTWPTGTRVYFSPWAGFSLFVNLREYVQIAEHEILGSFREAAEVYVA